MSLRDWFAGQAMAGFILKIVGDKTEASRDIAEISYFVADKMIAERDRSKEK